MSKVDRVVRRNKERALKARTLREKTMAGAAFEKGIQYGFLLYRAKLQKATEHLTYE